MMTSPTKLTALWVYEARRAVDEGRPLPPASAALQAHADSMLALHGEIRREPLRAGAPDPEWVPGLDHADESLRRISQVIQDAEKNDIAGALAAPLMLVPLDPGRWMIGHDLSVYRPCGGLGEAWAAFRAGPLGVAISGSRRAAWNRRDVAVRLVKPHDPRLADAVRACSIEGGRLVYRGREPVVTDISGVTMA